LNFCNHFYPEAKIQDRQLIKSGQRAQIINKDEAEEGIFKFGTEIVMNEDRAWLGYWVHLPVPPSQFPL
jgi:L-2-hydroxyglutarate oxidase LhgO